MPLDDADAEQQASLLWPEWQKSRDKSREWERWATGEQDLPAVPDSATAEYRCLQEEAVTPWLELVVQAIAEALVVEGYRRSGADDDNLAWGVWQANNMDAKQLPVYEAALTTGIAYVAVLPVDRDPSPRRIAPKVDGKPVPEWRTYSSSVMTAFYESAWDDWPSYAMAGEPEPLWRQSMGEPQRWRLALFDDEAVYHFVASSQQEPTLTGPPRPHSAGVCPVVGFVNRMTLEGRARGEVEPYVRVARRIDQDTLDRLVVQRYGAWNVRTATGLVTPETPEGQRKQEVDLAVSDILVSDSPDTRFGSLPGTELSGHLRAPIEDVRVLAAVSQTPPTHLSGDLANISAEALAALEAAHNRKIAARKMTFGEAWEKAFALSAHLVGADVDPSAEVRWADLESRSLGQQADAFGKLAQMLEIPVEVLWDKLGFLTDQDRERARELRDEQTQAANLRRMALLAMTDGEAGDADADAETERAEAEAAA